MKSVIIGAGTYGEVYLAYLEEAGVQIVGFLDDDASLWNREIRGKRVLGGTDRLADLREELDVEAVYCPIGSNEIRVRMLTRARQMGYRTPCYFHPSVILSPQISIANEGVYILPGTNVMPYVTIEKDVMISSGTNIHHHSYLAQGTFISTGVNFGANIRTEPYAYIGMSATIMTGIHRLGEGCLIGAGAVVIRDVEKYAIMAGVPARLIKYKDRTPDYGAPERGGGELPISYRLAPALPHLRKTTNHAA